jgi:hypothetical protein
MKEGDSKNNKFEKRYEKFKNKFRTERDCRRQLFKNRWPKGYRCPRCKNDEFYDAYEHGKSNIKLYQCKNKKCNYQSSVTSGTIFDKTRTKLIVWFRMIFLIAQRGKHLSTMEIVNEVGLKKENYKTIFLIRKKIEKELNKKRALKIFKGIARREDIERHQRDRRNERLRKVLKIGKKEK